MYNRVYHAKLRLKTALSDSVFRAMYADSSLRNTFNKKLVRLERKWHRTDSTTKANIDSLNVLKVKVADNSVNLSNMLNIMDIRLDKAVPQLFGQEINYLWQEPKKEIFTNDSSKMTQSMLSSEQKAIGYYFNQTSGKRMFVLVLGILLFFWLFLRRKLLKLIHEQKDAYAFLQLQYLNHHSVLSLLVLLLCLMPFFDAYAPTSYMAMEYLLLLTASSVIFFKKQNLPLGLDWLALVALFIVNTLTYLLIEPTLVARLWLLVVHAGIIAFSFRFYRNLSKEMPYYKLIKSANFFPMARGRCRPCSPANDRMG